MKVCCGGREETTQPRYRTLPPVEQKKENISSRTRKSLMLRCVEKKKRGNGRTFQARNEVSSMMVDWAISWPGNTPHVTALTESLSVLVLKSP